LPFYVLQNQNLPKEQPAIQKLRSTFHIEWNLIHIWVLMRWILNTSNQSHNAIT
jgi:hypothetical protein